LISDTSVDAAEVVEMLPPTATGRAVLSVVVVLADESVVVLEVLIVVEAPLATELPTTADDCGDEAANLATAGVTPRLK